MKRVWLLSCTTNNYLIVSVQSLMESAEASLKFLSTRLKRKKESSRQKRISAQVKWAPGIYY